MHGQKFLSLDPDSFTNPYILYTPTLHSHSTSTDPHHRRTASSPEDTMNLIRKFKQNPAGHNWVVAGTVNTV